LATSGSLLCFGAGCLVEATLLIASGKNAKGLGVIVGALAALFFLAVNISNKSKL